MATSLQMTTENKFNIFIYTVTQNNLSGVCSWWSHSYGFTWWPWHLMMTLTPNSNSNKPLSGSEMILFTDAYAYRDHLCMCPANERRRYIVRSSLIGWAHTQNDPCIWVRSWNCVCLVTWFCYQLIAKPGNKTVTVSWPWPIYPSADFSVRPSPSFWFQIWIYFVMEICIFEIISHSHLFSTKQCSRILEQWVPLESCQYQIIYL